MSSLKKYKRELVRALEKQGYRNIVVCRSGGGHLRVAFEDSAGNAAVTFASATPSDGARTVKNFVSQARQNFAFQIKIQQEGEKQDNNANNSPKHLNV